MRKVTEREAGLGQTVQFVVEPVTSSRQFAFRLADDVLEGYKVGDVFLIDPLDTVIDSGSIVLASVAGAAASLYRYEAKEERVHLRQKLASPADRGFFPVAPGDADEPSGALILGVAVALERGRNQL